MNPLPEPASLARVWWFRGLALILILGSAWLRIAYLQSDIALDLSPDEAHYWDWSRRLDYSYYSKGPLVALLIRAGTELFGQEMWAVRFPAVVCGSLLLAGLYVLTALAFRREDYALVVVGVGLTMPVLSAGSSLITIDSPYTCLWTWALVFGYLAVFFDKSWAWPAAGAMVALGILAKYTMILWVPSFLLFLFFTKPYRRLFFRPGLWVLLATGALGGIPILYWNWQNHWVSLRHLQGHAGMQERTVEIYWLGPLHFVGVQFALLLGYWFVVWVCAMWKYRPWKSVDSGLSYLWWMSAPMFGFFALFSLKNGGGEANWPITAYLSGNILAMAWLAQQWQSPRAGYRALVRCFLIGFLAFGTALTVLVHCSTLAYPLLTQWAGPPRPGNAMPLRRVDPTCRLKGWKALAREVDRLREELRLQGIEPLVVGAVWHTPGELGFYCQGQPQAYSLGPALGDRHSQYDLWHPNPVANPEVFQGKTFIVVSGGSESGLSSAFERLEPARPFVHWVHGQPINQWVVTVGHGYRGFPQVPGLRNY